MLSLPPRLIEGWLGSGSGKFTTPCERMHLEYFSAVASIFDCCAGVSGEPFGSRCWQALLAEEYAGALAGLADPLPPSWNPPWLFGSGKFPTPWARMHLA